MKKPAVLCAIALMALLLIISAAGCQQQPEPITPSIGPTTLAILVESNTVEAGSSFMVSGSNFKPSQKVWVDVEWRATDRTENVQYYCEADENGSVHPVIDVPEYVVPGDYEIEVLTGKNVREKELLTTLPIRIR